MLAVFDIGGTHMHIGIAKGYDQIYDSVIVHTPRQFEKGIELLLEKIRDLAKGEEITEIAGGVAGPLDSRKQLLLQSPNLPLWVGKPIAKEVTKNLRSPVLLENDAALGGLGESVYGAGKGYKIVAYISVGTGVGGSKIVNGQIDKNAYGYEPGHQIIVIDGKPDACGAKGHLEAYVSGKALKNTYGVAPEEISDKNIWAGIAYYLAVGINNTIVYWLPDIVIISGSVGMRIPLDGVENHLKTMMTIFPKKPNIVYGKLGKLSGLYGGLRYLKLRNKKEESQLFL